MVATLVRPVGRDRSNKVLNSLVQEHILAIVSDGRIHETPEIVEQLMPVLKPIIDKMGRFLDGDVKLAPAEILVKSRITRVMTRMVRYGLLEDIRVRFVKGTRVFSVALPGARNTGITAINSAYPWRDTLEGFQRQARYYLETKQFDKMGL